MYASENGSARRPTETGTSHREVTSTDRLLSKRNCYNLRKSRLFFGKGTFSRLLTSSLCKSEHPPQIHSTLRVRQRVARVHLRQLMPAS